MQEKRVQKIFDKDYLVSNKAAQLLICAVHEQTGWLPCGLKAIVNEQWESGM
jgi:hypothetical protein